VKIATFLLLLCEVAGFAALVVAAALVSAALGWAAAGVALIVVSNGWPGFLLPGPKKDRREEPRQ
jgi:hypothetical protein